MAPSTGPFVRSAESVLVSSSGHGFHRPSDRELGRRGELDAPDQVPLYPGTKNQPEVFQTEVFSWTSARDVRAKMLVFPGFGGPDRSFWPDVRRDVRPKTSVFGLIFRF